MSIKDIGKEKGNPWISFFCKTFLVQLNDGKTLKIFVLVCTSTCPLLNYRRIFGYEFQIFP
jgi:hypothetical protein